MHFQRGAAQLPHTHHPIAAGCGHLQASQRVAPGDLHVAAQHILFVMHSCASALLCLHPPYRLQGRRAPRHSCQQPRSRFRCRTGRWPEARRRTCPTGTACRMRRPRPAGCPMGWRPGRSQGLRRGAFPVCSLPGAGCASATHSHVNSVCRLQQHARLACTHLSGSQTKIPGPCPPRLSRGRGRTESCRCLAAPGAPHPLCTPAPPAAGRPPPGRRPRAAGTARGKRAPRLRRPPGRPAQARRRCGTPAQPSRHWPACRHEPVSVSVPGRCCSPGGQWLPAAPPPRLAATECTLFASSLAASGVARLHSTSCGGIPATIGLPAIERRGDLQAEVLARVNKTTLLKAGAAFLRTWKEGRACRLTSTLLSHSLQSLRCPQWTQMDREMLLGASSSGLRCCGSRPAR